MTNGAGPRNHSKTSRFVGGLDEDFDLQVLRTLQGKTTVVPVISKADTITTAHMAFLKKTVSESLKLAGLDPLEALHLDADEGLARLEESGQKLLGARPLDGFIPIARVDQDVGVKKGRGHPVHTGPPVARNDPMAGSHREWAGD